MNIPTDEQSFDYTFEPDDVRFNVVTGPTREQLQKISPRHLKDYEDFKTAYVGWFVNVGKTPNKNEGYAPRTVEQISTKTDQVFRYFWKVRGVKNGFRYAPTSSHSAK